MKKLFLIICLFPVFSITNAQQPADSVTASLKTYQNYDFVPGEKIIFEDHFNDDQDGEFPAHWKLLNGQAVTNKVAGRQSLVITEGNYGVVIPRIKTEKYLSDEFTVEFDFIFKSVVDAGYGSYSGAVGVEFYYTKPGDGYESSFRVNIGINDIIVDQLSKSYSDNLLEGFGNKWHHAALVYKKGQMKSYIDQCRVCVNPNLEFKPDHIAFDGAANESNPVIFTGVKIANGGGMNLIGKKFTQTKIITHGINFDVNKANIKPESMGTLNNIVQLMKDNPELKFEIGGHTDSDGDDASNLKLSQARAESVRTQLVSMGIENVRLIAKGYGETKPLNENITPEGKANNRRVEFIKQ